MTETPTEKHSLDDEDEGRWRSARVRIARIAAILRAIKAGQLLDTPSDAAPMESDHRAGLIMLEKLAEEVDQLEKMLR